MQRHSKYKSVLNFNKPDKDVLKMIEMGGPEMLMRKDIFGQTGLHHYAIQRQSSIEILTKMIEVGKRELVLEQDNNGTTVLHHVFEYYERENEVIMKLIEAGGRELLMKKDSRGNNALHFACIKKSEIQVIQKLIEIGGSELVAARNNHGETALHYAYFYYSYHDGYDNANFNLMMKESIKAHVGGEFGIGGLFDRKLNGIVQRKIYRELKDLAPLLKRIFMLLELHPPIMHAAIFARAPQNIIRDIIKQFDCIYTKDSFNRLPFDVGVH